MKHTGGCHCGNISIVFESALNPAQIEVRACQCSFCRRHSTRAVADPGGMLTIKVADQARLSRYTFGYGTAEYFICRECGVYVGASTLDEHDRRAIIIVDVLDDRELFNQDLIAVSYDSEDRNQRLKRRSERWTPVSIELG